MSKAVDSLLKRGFVEESVPVDQVLGRPGKLVRMAADSAAVLGVVIDAAACSVTIAGLDGRVSEDQTRRGPTPDTYAALIDLIELNCRRLLRDLTGRVHGIGVSVPGLINERLEEIVCSPTIAVNGGRTCW